MPLLESDSIILKTYPLADADRIVVFFTRDHGKIRGVANGVRKLTSPFGASLEPMAHSRVTFFQKETQELVRIRSTELIDSPMKLLADYDRAVLASRVADLVDRFLPDRDAQETVFRLFVLTRQSLIEDVPLNLIQCYFEVWMLRLAGVLPDVFVCSACHHRLGTEADRVLLSGLKQMVCGRCGRDQGTAVPRSTIAAMEWMMRHSLSRIWENPERPDLPDADGLHHVLQLNKLWIDQFFER